MPRSRGFTLFELVIALVILGIISLIVVPSLLRGQGARAVTTAASMLAADIEYCESACINTPQAPCVIKFDVANNRYWVARASTPDTPLPNSLVDGTPYVVDFATGRSATLNGVTIVSVTPATTLAFDAFGRPNSGGATPTITFSGGGSTATVTIDPTTGEVTTSP